MSESNIILQVGKTYLTKSGKRVLIERYETVGVNANCFMGRYLDDYDNTVAAFNKHGMRLGLYGYNDLVSEAI